MATAIDTAKDGSFIRKESIFRNHISKEPGNLFQPESGRYHLYAAISCPWAHRTLIVRQLKGLSQVISLTIVNNQLDFQGGKGWVFTKDQPDPVNNLAGLKEIYLMCDPEYKGRYTVPLLFDKKTNKIVNNESSEIIVMFNQAFNDFCSDEISRSLDLYPLSLRKDIDQINEWVYNQINNGVYKCGFAVTQSAYEEAFDLLFEGLDKAEAILSKSRYLVGDSLTLSDIRLFTTLIRFEPVYYFLFKCNKKRLVDYPNLWAFTRSLYQMPLIKSTVSIDEYKKGYFWTMITINPNRIIPKGPDSNEFIRALEVPVTTARS